MTSDIPIPNVTAQTHATPVVLVDKTTGLPYNSSITGGSGGTAAVDKESFVEGAGSFTPIGGVYNQTISADPTEDQTAAARITAKRAIHVNLRDASGNEVAVGGGTQYADGAAKGTSTGTLMMVDDGTLIQSASGDSTGKLNVNLSNAIPTGANVIGAVTQNGTWNVGTVSTVTNVVHVDDNASSLTVDGTVTANAGTGNFTVIQGTGTNLHTVVDSGTITSVTNLAQLGGQAVAMGTGVRTAGTTRVTVATDDVVPVTDNSGSLTVDQPTGTNLHTVVDSGTVTTVSTVTNLSQQGGVAISLNTGVRDTGTQRVTIATNDVVPVTDNSGSITVDQPTGTNLHTVIDSGTVTTVSTVTAVTGITNALPAGTNTLGSIRITDGTATATVRDLAANDALNVAIVDASGAHITSFGGGTQYTEGDTDATITGTVAMWEDAANTVVATSATKPLPVNIISGAGSGGTAMTDDAAFTPATTSITPVGGTYRSSRDTVDANDAGAFAMTASRALLAAIEDTTGTSAMDDTNHAVKVNVVAGGAGDGAILDGVISSIKATVLDYTNSNPIAVRLTDTAGDYIAAGSGTQYTEDAAAAADPIGTMQMAVRLDSLAAITTTDGDNIAVRATNKGEQYVKHVDAINVTQTTGTNLHAVIDSGAITVSGSLTNIAGAISLPTGAATETTLSAINTKLVSGTDIGDVTINNATGAGAVYIQDGGNSITVDLVAGATAIAKAEDVASADADVGVPSMAVRKATPANTSGTDGDYEMLQMSAGRLWTSATVDAALPAGTNAIGKLAANDGVDIGDVTLNNASIAVTQTTGSNLHTVVDSGTITTVSSVTAIAGALPAGTNNIGDMDVLSIAAGDNNIGNVDVVTLPALATGTNTIGSVKLTNGTYVADVDADLRQIVGSMPSAKTEQIKKFSVSVAAGAQTAQVIDSDAATNRAIKEIYVSGYGADVGAYCTFKRGATTIGDIYLSAVPAITKDQLQYSTSTLTMDCLISATSAVTVYIVVKYYQ